MQRKYYQIFLLVDQLGPWNPRLDAIQKIIQKPDFQYKKEEGADIVLVQFLRSSYWLDQELFDESYLYQKSTRGLNESQKTHLKMVDIGAKLLSKGFPLQYDSTEYAVQGKDQLASYVKTFVNQCHKRYRLIYNHARTKSPCR